MKAESVVDLIRERNRLNRLNALRAQMSAAALAGILGDPRYCLPVEEAVEVAFNHGDALARLLLEAESMPSDGLPKSPNT